MAARLGAGVLLIATCAPTRARGEVVPLGPPLESDQLEFYTDVASLPGGFVTVWVRADLDGRKIYARRFDSAGVAVGTELVVSPPGHYLVGRVDADARGAFVVAWQVGAPGVIDEFDVLARRFDAEGAPLGDAFAVNSYATGSQLAPDVAVAVDGSFVVAWEEQGRRVVSDIWVKRYDPSGNALAEVQVSESASRYDQRPVAIALADGSFVVAWSRDRGLRGRVLSPDVGPTELALGDRMMQFHPPALAKMGTGFVLAWPIYNYTEAQATDVWSARFDADAAHLEPDRTFTPGVPDLEINNVYPDVAADGSGFVVVWDSASYYDYEPGDGIFGDFGPATVHGARMDADGVRTDDFLLVPQGSDARIAMHGDGTFLVVWSSGRQAFCDTAGRQLGCGTTRCLTLPRTAGVIDVTASDALTILRGALGDNPCPLCVCDVDSSGTVTAGDALRALRRGIGLTADLSCPAC